ncbi:MAG: archaeosortase/exosortase family protein [Thermoplasmata archaeon]
MPELDDAVDFLKKYRGYFLLLEFILLLTGINLVILPQKVVWLEYVGVVLFLSGVALLVLTFMPEEGEEKPREKALARRIVEFFSVRLKLKPIFPVLGIIVFALDFAYNLLVFGGLSLGTHDYMLLLFGGGLVAYNFVPERYGRERDFFLMFSGVLVLILIVPLLLMRMLEGDMDASVNAYSAIFLVPETNAILNLLGVPSSIGVVDGIPSLTFPPELGLDELAVTTSCSGIYSFSIFASAFTAFILTEYSRPNWRVGGLLVLGFVSAYVANLLRIVIVVLVGVYAPGDDPMQALLQAHSNAGWMIFVLWITLFWLIMYKVLMKEKLAEPAIEETRKRGTLCGICGDVLSPSVPGVRCSCGRFYHAECLEESGSCPACDKEHRRDDLELTAQAEIGGAKGLS